MAPRPRIQPRLVIGLLVGLWGCVDQSPDEGGADASTEAGPSLAPDGDLGAAPAVAAPMDAATPDAGSTAGPTSNENTSSSDNNSEIAGPDATSPLSPTPGSETPTVFIQGNTVSGRIEGMDDGDEATIILGNDQTLSSQRLGADGEYTFSEVPAGTYFLKVSANGYDAPSSRNVVVEGGTVTETPDTLPTELGFALSALNIEGFSYHWSQDVSRAGHQVSAYVNSPPVIEILDEAVQMPDLAAAQVLRHDYNVVLDDDEALWSEEHAYRLLETLRRIPQALRDSHQAQNLAASKWTLAPDFIQNDITIVEEENGVRNVRIAVDSFANATPRLATLDGVRTRFYSQRLHHALVRFVTDEGRDHEAVERILTERYGTSTEVMPTDAEGAPLCPAELSAGDDAIAALTSATTVERCDSFQGFKPNELVEIINMFEEMPEGFHALPGLDYIIRRKDGQPHPLYDAPAVAWPFPELDNGYIEFMDSAFNTDYDHMHRLILHEKAHFLWARLLSPDTQAEWVDLGGWYINPDDSDGWSTTKTTEFVSAYAHQHNPDEDFAESIAYYIINPDALRSRAPAKYEFIRDRVMHGTRYVAQIRQDLTFEVLNLYPDYDYPGKIDRVDITVQGAPQAEKTVTVEIGLNTVEGLFDGASQAFLKIHSEIGTYRDLYLQPVDESGSTLRGTFTLSETAKAGYWSTDQIVVTDRVGNQRLEGVDDYGFKLYVDNPLEDTQKPTYVDGSLEIDVVDDVYVVSAGENRPIRRVTVRYDIVDDSTLRSNAPTYASFINADSQMYQMESYGTFSGDEGQYSAEVEFMLTEYHQPGTWHVPYVSFYDRAENQSDQYFSIAPAEGSDHDEAVVVTIEPIEGTQPDLSPPILDAEIGAIEIVAAPTNPQTPDGETSLNIRYEAWDPAVENEGSSGLGVVSLRLLDPQGTSHHEFHYHENFYTPFFDGEATRPKVYEFEVVLPVGSPPGTWGVQTFELRDKAGNVNAYNFLETLRFDVIDDQ